MDEKKKARKSKKNKTDIGEERRVINEDYDLISAILDKSSADEVYAIMKERGSIRGIML